MSRAIKIQIMQSKTKTQKLRLNSFAVKTDSRGYETRLMKYKRGINSNFLIPPTLSL